MHAQFANRPLALARLYAAAFAADPGLTKDLAAGHRYRAARVAAQAGCGQGADATDLGKKRARWRAQARQWLRADLTARARAFNTGSTATFRTPKCAALSWYAAAWFFRHLRSYYRHA